MRISAMSFNSFAPELLTKIFSHLLDVRTKVRLERVSKRFRDCIKNAESWKYNTELSIVEGLSLEELRSFLDHTKVITHLSFNWYIRRNMLALLWSFGDKLKLKSFTEATSAVCPCHSEVIGCVFGKYSHSLEIVDVTGCWDEELCATADTFDTLLPLCKNLRHLTFFEFQCGLPYLLHTSLSSIRLNRIPFNEYFRVKHLAAVFNTAKNYSLSSLTLETGANDSKLDFSLHHFCELLEPAAARAIKTIRLDRIACKLIQILQTLPMLLPNLSLFSLTDDGLNDAQKMADAIGSSMNACLRRETSIRMRLKFRCQNEEIKTHFWIAVHLVQVWHGGTKRTLDMRHWKRSLTNGVATVDLDVE